MVLEEIKNDSEVDDTVFLRLHGLDKVNEREDFDSDPDTQD